MFVGLMLFFYILSFQTQNILQYNFHSVAVEILRSLMVFDEISKVRQVPRITLFINEIEFFLVDMFWRE